MILLGSSRTNTDILDLSPQLRRTQGDEILVDARRSLLVKLAVCGAAGFAGGQASAWALQRVDAPAILTATLACVVAGAVVGALVQWSLLRPMQRAADAATAAADDRHVMLQAALARRTFDARLARALEATASEHEVVHLAARAAEEIAPHMPGQLLLVGDDGSDVLRAASATSSMAPAMGCPVATLGGCRAVQHGRTELFDSSETLDACVHLRARPDGPRAALCVPVTVAGRNVGVLHVTSDPDTTIGPDEIVRFEELATQAAARISLLRAVEHATEQAATDPLTGASNRRALDARVRMFSDEGREFALVIADLDHFKRVNDEFGHDTGDRTLRAFADAMRRTLRPDDLVARFGGDEFVMVISGCRAEQAATVIERVRKEFARGIEAAQLPSTSASFGIADSTSGRTTSTILAVADEALLDAKRAGRDRVCIAAATGAIDLTA